MKKKAYLKEMIGDHFMLGETYVWKAVDEFGMLISYGETKEECVKECLKNGYEIQQ